MIWVDYHVYLFIMIRINVHILVYCKAKTSQINA
jgi:hypothetical protein